MAGPFDEHTSGVPGDDVDEETAWVDDLGRRAGEAIRTPASAAGLQALKQRQARRRAATAIGTSAGVIALVVGALVIVNRGDSAKSPPVGIGPAPTTDDAATTAPALTATPAPTSTVMSQPISTTSVPTTTAAPRPTETTTVPGIPPQMVFDQLPASDRAGLQGRTIRYLPDGKNLFVSPYDEGAGAHLIIDGDTGQVLRSFLGASGFFVKSISPDGSRLFDGLTLWDLETAAAVSRLPSAEAGVLSVFSPDSRWLAVIGLDGQMKFYEVLDARTGEVVWSTSSPGNGFSGELWFSSDSAQVYMAGRSFEVATGEPRSAPPDRPPTTELQGFAADDSLVSALAGPYKICKPVMTFIVGTLEGQGHRCAISPDGSRIAMLTGDGSVVEIWTLEGVRGR